METGTIIGIVIAAVVVLLLIAAVALLLKRRGAHQRHERLQRAEGLRGEAASHHSEVAAAARRAQAADAEAGQARAVADRAEHAAAEAHRDLAREQAVQEDAVREADRLDPRVDHTADDYHPVTGPDMKASTADVEPLPPGADAVTDAEDGRHRA